jgi:hypothetical protein
MSRLVVPIWTSVVIVLGGIWSVVIPFVGSMGTTVSMAHSMSMASSAGTFLGIAGSTYVYHIIPGGVVALVGIYQLVRGFMRERRPATPPVAEQSVQRG